MIDARTKRDFQTSVIGFYREHGRHDLPWRLPDPNGRFDPYKIMVSELMLQQTQVSRVIPKYHEFLTRFPSVQALAEAPLGEVLRIWNGLGYNRRAKYLHQSAQAIIRQHPASFPHDIASLVALPGIGVNSAGAILAYAFDRPVTFIETNIRTVFIHHFFTGLSRIQDKSIIELVTDTLPEHDIRGWYWGLMDYGAHIKRTLGNPNQASTGYAKQTTFVGSRRQLRGQLIRLLGESPQAAGRLSVAIDDERLDAVLNDLLQEGLIHKTGAVFHL